MTRRADLERYTTLLYSTYAQVCVRLERWRFIDNPLSSDFAIAHVRFRRFQEHADRWDTIHVVFVCQI
jgi:hypothetical protein